MKKLNLFLFTFLTCLVAPTAQSAEKAEGRELSGRKVSQIVVLAPEHIEQMRALEARLNQSGLATFNGRFNPLGSSRNTEIADSANRFADQIQSLLDIVAESASRESSPLIQANEIGLILRLFRFWLSFDAGPSPGNTMEAIYRRYQLALDMEINQIPEPQVRQALTRYIRDHLSADQDSPPR